MLLIVASSLKANDTLFYTNNGIKRFNRYNGLIQSIR